MVIRKVFIKKMPLGTATENLEILTLLKSLSKSWKRLAFPINEIYSCIRLLLNVDCAIHFK